MIWQEKYAKKLLRIISTESNYYLEAKQIV